MPRPLRVVDLGGGAAMWRRWGITAADDLKITLVNPHESDTTGRVTLDGLPFINEREADATELTPEDLRAFDLVFSNSMFEHLSSREQQVRLARTIIDSGRPYFVQVPNKASPVDPHFPHPAVPFFAMYPREIQARLLTLHGFGGGRRARSIEDAYDRLGHYFPLGRTDVRRLFPTAQIQTERNLGLPMSLVARSAAI